MLRWGFNQCHITAIPAATVFMMCKDRKAVAKHRSSKERGLELVII